MSMLCFSSQHILQMLRILIGLLICLDGMLCSISAASNNNVFFCLTELHWIIVMRIFICRQSQRLEISMLIPYSILHQSSGILDQHGNSQPVQALQACVCIHSMADDGNFAWNRFLLRHEIGTLCSCCIVIQITCLWIKTIILCYKYTI